MNIARWTLNIEQPFKQQLFELNDIMQTEPNWTGFY